MKIVFATNNKHKLEEIKDILGKEFEIVSLAEIGCHEDIPETGATLEENARQKSSYVVEHYGQNCFADDTGLEVEALGGEPGVHSARYAEGTDHDSEANMRKKTSDAHSPPVLPQSQGYPHDNQSQSKKRFQSSFQGCPLSLRAYVYYSLQILFSSL